MYLSIYDISGIQKFIFSSSKLKEQVGGSRIVHHILYELLPEVLGEEKKEGKWNWQENEALFDFGEKGYNIVYIGGGNAMVLYENADIMFKKTREMEKKVLVLTNCELRLCHAYVDLDSDDNKNKNYNKLYNDLMKELSIVKNNPSEIKLASGFAINEYHSVTLEPLTMVETGNNGKCYDVANHMMKRKFFKESKEFNNNDIRFADQFEKFRNDTKKSFVAVVHIDGDSMGKQIQIAMEDIGEKNKLKNSMLKMRDISMNIDKLYSDTMNHLLGEYYKDYKGTDKVAAFRKIVSDGDDITFIISAEEAFDFVEKFMVELKSVSEKKKISEEHDFKVSASAGIVFVHDKYPFDEAYDLAEQLCKSAKEIKKDDGNYRYVCSMDFHIISSGIRGDIKEFRKKNYIKLGTEKANGILNLRPYFFDARNEPNSYSNFKNLREWVKGSEGVARSKLKGLRNAYGEGYEAANSYYDFILSRDQGGIMGAETAFYGEDWECRARFFDALDSMDM